MSSSTTSRAILPQSAHALGRSSCSSASRWLGIGLRPVGFAFVFGCCSSDGFSGAVGRSSKARRASPSTVGGAAGGFSTGSFRCLRCATASSSDTRSFSRASSVRCLAVQRRKLEAPSLEAFREYAPARAVEPQGLRDPPALVEKQVEVAVDGIEPEVPHGACECVERTAHVERRDRHEHAHRRRQAQHERTSSRGRRRWRRRAGDRASCRGSTRRFGRLRASRPSPAPVTCSWPSRRSRPSGSWSRRRRAPRRCRSRRP